MVTNHCLSYAIIIVCALGIRDNHLMTENLIKKIESLNYEEDNFTLTGDVFVYSKHQ